ncbi:MAG: xanthine dehydrogenase small subunit [Bacteriovoracaceae bacterium]
MRNLITFYLNGERHTVPSEHSTSMLADYLRYVRGLTGTKIVCAEGDCGACTVLRNFPYGENSEQFLTVNSCIIPLISLDGSHILTIESLKDGDRLHESQRAMMECHGSQCGFCTPGFVMAYAALCDQKKMNDEKTISEKECKNATTGNLCRCTGYKDIINAGTNIDVAKEKSLIERFHTKDVVKELRQIISESLMIEKENLKLFAPVSLAEALVYLKNNSDVRIVGFGTDLGVVHNKRKIELSKILSLHLINELYENKLEKNKVYIGARTTISELRQLLKDKCNEFVSYLDIFASPQIKNGATLIGNIANASPIGDTPPVMLVLNAKVHLKSVHNIRTVEIDKFFLDYRKINREQDELIVGIEFDLPSEEEKLIFRKTSLRKDLDISTLNLALRWKIKDDVIENIKIAAGGIAKTPLRLHKMEQYLIGKMPTESNIEQALAIGHQEFKPISDVRSTASYRRVVFSHLIKRNLNQEVNI